MTVALTRLARKGWNPEQVTKNKKILIGYLARENGNRCQVDKTKFNTKGRQVISVMVLKRGALIVIEGVDRTGKTTQCKKLVENLCNKEIPAEYTNFPNRTSEIGKVINSYLTSKKELPDEAIHLLFSANRWEKANHIINLLENGTTVIVDRYCFSGVAFSAAKGLDVNWCKAPDAGLPKPDKVFFLNMSLENAQKRNGFGNERYEVLDFQKKVVDAYMQLKEDNWEILDASRSLEVIQDELLQKTTSIIDHVGSKSIKKIWL